MNRLGLRHVVPLVFAYLVVHFCFAVWDVVSADLQWDFHTYYYAARFYADGGNPYDLEALRAAHPQAYHPYVYPPITLPAFVPFTHLDFVPAAGVFVALKVPVLAALILLWKRLFATNALETIALLAFCIFAYRQTIYIDLQAGNISLFEQLLIWLAAVCFLRKRPALFCLLITLSALFKLTSILLLPIVLVDRDRRSVLSVVCGAAALVVIHGLSWITQPALGYGFLSSLQLLGEERGSMNAASFSFIRTYVDYLADWAGFDPGRLPAVLYFIFVGALSATAFLMLRRIDFRGRRMELIVLVFFFYTLVLPRLKGYSFIMLLVPSLIVIRDALPNWWLRGLAVALIFAPLSDYRSLLVSLGLFVIYMVYVRRTALSRPAESAVLPDEPLTAAQRAGL